MIRLDRPHVRVHRSYLEAHDEFAALHRDGDGDRVEPADDGGYPGVTWSRAELETPDGFARFVAVAPGPGSRGRPPAHRARAPHVAGGPS